ncbi:hypothetical protein MBCUT_07330 [Methanobrevibacter cuticularis]|uniref:Haloacid dehalogenase-like hydrolase n=1 Tax=Methanobrevibacter cuticularis TaxID=47311 RepID=A0A166EF55_9EURY|nr:hypothetical protein [Methanobrevibacter cuticularis]KZX16579.1 hypothetical protein MBCUT_07330 [Methanobrevibacter cuticularis]
MIKKLFITDCEGPLSLNDNAYEISSEFIPEGDEFFKIISKFDDYLVDIAKKPDYNAGGTLKLIVPFFKAYGITNQKIIDFSKEKINLVDGVEKTLELAENAMSSFIVSTSYGQYIEALCNYLDFPFENTYYTHLDMYDSYELSDNEKEKLFEFRDTIVKIARENSPDFDKLNEIFFDEIPKMEIAKLIENINTVGGEGKKLAIKDIVSKCDCDKNGIMYVGDSITDVEPLKYAKKNGGLAISFNGNEYALKEAEIAIITNNTLPTSLLLELHSKFNKEYVFEFIRSYSKNPQNALETFKFGHDMIDEFNETFKGKFPIIEVIREDNLDELIKKSIIMRKEIRGNAIGSLGK